MVAIINRDVSLMGALYYNHRKVAQENAKVLFGQKIIEAPDGSYPMAKLSRSFELYLLANRKTEKPILHISINPDPKDKVSDADFSSIAQDYMKHMGYAEQPFVVFKHTDIDRTHIHIVSVCVDEDGRKISDKFEKRRSMDVCRALEKEYNLAVATEQKQDPNGRIFRPVDYKAGDIKSQMASVLRYLPEYYKFQTYGAYNALLSLFNITAEQVKGEYNGKPKQGKVYFALNDKGEKASNPFKASLFGKTAGYAQLQSHYDQNRIGLKDNPAKAIVKNKIELAMRTASRETDFKKQLVNQGISTVTRRNTQGRIYGITFIDHTSKTVWNGSELDKNLSANKFNEWWNNGNKPEVNNDVGNTTNIETGFAEIEKFRNQEYGGNLIEGLGGLLPNAKGEDFEEENFANQMKKKTRRIKR